jgi:hypothetical protein
VQDDFCCKICYSSEDLLAQFWCVVYWLMLSFVSSTVSANCGIALCTSCIVSWVDRVLETAARTPKQAEQVRGGLLPCMICRIGISPQSLRVSRLLCRYAQYSASPDEEFGSQARIDAENEALKKAIDVYEKRALVITSRFWGSGIIDLTHEE